MFSPRLANAEAVGAGITANHRELPTMRCSCSRSRLGTVAGNSNVRDGVQRPDGRGVGLGWLFQMQAHRKIGHLLIATT